MVSRRLRRRTLAVEGAPPSREAPLPAMVGPLLLFRSALARRRLPPFLLPLSALRLRPLLCLAAAWRSAAVGSRRLRLSFRRRPRWEAGRPTRRRCWASRSPRAVVAGPARRSRRLAAQRGAEMRELGKQERQERRGWRARGERRERVHRRVPRTRRSFRPAPWCGVPMLLFDSLPCLPACGRPPPWASGARRSDRRERSLPAGRSVLRTLPQQRPFLHLLFRLLFRFPRFFWWLCRVWRRSSRRLAARWWQATRKPPSRSRAEAFGAPPGPNAAGAPPRKRGKETATLEEKRQRTRWTPSTLQGRPGPPPPPPQLETLRHPDLGRNPHRHLHLPLHRRLLRLLLVPSARRPLPRLPRLPLC